MNKQLAISLVALILTLCGCARSAKQDSLDYRYMRFTDRIENYWRQARLRAMAKASNQSKNHARNSLVAKLCAAVARMGRWASIYREEKLNGFGLWINNKDGGFSWNWFTRESGQIYRKLKGEGRVKALFVPDKDYEELSAVEFMDDIALSGNFGWLPFGDTHQMVIKKGSVLRLAH